MTDAPPDDRPNAPPEAPPRGRRGVLRRGLHHLLTAALGAAVLILVAGLLAGWFLLGGWDVPDGLRARVEQRLNAGLTAGRVEIAGIRLALVRPEAPANDTGRETAHAPVAPVVTLSGLTVLNADGAPRFVLPRVSARLSAVDLFAGRIRPVDIRLDGADIRLRRDSDGRFDIALGGGGLLAESETLAEVIATVEDLLHGPLLGGLDSIRASGLRLAFDDALSGRQWRFRDGAVLFDREGARLSATLRVTLDNRVGAPATASFSVAKTRGRPLTGFSSRFDNLRTEDVADQVPALDWLRALDAPIAGAMTFSVTGDGRFSDMNGVLELGAGTIRQAPIGPRGAGRAAAFSGAKVYLRYADAEQRFDFDQITVDTALGRLDAEGRAYLSDRIDRTVGGLIAQLRFSRIELGGTSLFAAPVAFDMGALDMRIGLSPLKIEIGQAVLKDSWTKYRLKGRLAAQEGGWAGRLELRAGELPVERVMALWPLPVAPRTRDWMARNALGGRVSDVNMALDLKPGDRPGVTMGWNVREGSIRFLRGQPPITGLVGYAVMARNQMTMVAEQGIVTTPGGEVIDITGTTMLVENTRMRGSPARLNLKARGSVQGVLELLDGPPFRFLQKGGVKPDIATGSASVAGLIRFPLKRRVRFSDVTLNLSGQIRNARSDRLVPGRALTAEVLDVAADNGGVTITGAGFVGRVPVNGSWRLDFGPAAHGRSHVDGQIELSSLFLEEFGIALPKGSVTGAAIGHVSIDLTKGKAPRFRLRSDLNRARLKLAMLGWSKPANRIGELDVTGRFGTPVVIEKLLFRAKGLSAEGRVRLAAAGGLEEARLSRVRVGDWLDAPVVIRPGPRGQPVFVLDGGRMDLRRSPYATGAATAAPSGEGGAGGARIVLGLDRMVLSRGLALTEVEGAVESTPQGLRGAFEGRVNGGARIMGRLAPAGEGTGLKFTSADGGAVMRSAGVFASAFGGQMDLLLIPRKTAGEYDGRLRIRKTRVRGASALADLLSAISVVGLLEQLDGKGIAFNDVTARFRLTPRGVLLQESSAVGASLGITMQGSYDFEAGRMDMEGVITPIYLLNGLLEQTRIFGKLFGKQKGEGLFGFTYRMTGPVDRPKVTVNPLAILTPGLFREIFRKPLPPAPGSATEPERKRKKPAVSPPPGPVDSPSSDR